MTPSPESSAESPLPALRSDIDVIPVEHEGKQVFVLQDREGFEETPVAVSPQGLAVISLLDGRNKLSGIKSMIAQHTGALFHDQEILGLIEQLSKAGLLETPETQAKRKKILQDFLASPTRQARLAGSVYPKETLKLAGVLGEYSRHPKGPGKPLPEAPHRKTAPLGLIAPHIDFQRGGPAYAWAYHALAECPPPDLIVALGVAHASPNAPWTTTKKSYETPHGPMTVDEDLYRDIRESLWYDPSDEEWVHRNEHSLETQAVWLKFLWRDKTPPWLPILCSAFERFCPDQAPSSAPSIEEAIQKIGQKLALKQQAGKKILILAAVDLAHVGPRFGDEIELGKETESRIESEDRKSLEHALHLKADEFYLSVVADGHWRKVCGLSALYTSLRWIKMLNNDLPTSSRLLTYAQAQDPAGGIVSFASAVFDSKADI